MSDLSILFVCTANICRSPFLELTARSMAGPDAGLTFSSAGTMGFQQHPMDEVMAGVLAPDASGFRSRPLTPAVLADVDLVLTAEREHRSRILEDQPALLRRVFTVGQFAAGVAAHPGVHGAELISAQGRRRTAPTAEQDISDPYRRGQQVAEEAAELMTRLLAQIVPALARQA